MGTRSCTFPVCLVARRWCSDERRPDTGERGRSPYLLDAGGLLGRCVPAHAVPLLLGAAVRASLPVRVRQRGAAGPVTADVWADRIVSPDCDVCGREGASYDYAAQLYLCGACEARWQHEEHLRVLRGVAHRVEVIAAA